MNIYTITNITPITELSNKVQNRLSIAATLAHTSDVKHMHHGACLKIKG
jgi:hypothetical protein